MEEKNIPDADKDATLILLHGWGQTSRAFEPLVELLRDDLRIITFDFPGHGEAKEDGGPYTFERYIETLADVVKSLNGGPFHLLGWSMGGTVAALYCLDGAGPLPESLILMSATPKFVIPEKNLGIGQHPAAVKKMERMIRADHEAGLRDFIGRFFDSGEVIAEDMRAEIERVFYPDSFPPKKEALLGTLADLAKADLTARGAGAYNGPMLLIHGRLDRICPAGGQKLWKNLFPNISEFFINDAAHAPHLTRRREVAGAIKNFISGSL